jgi:hypothetical protein
MHWPPPATPHSSTSPSTMISWPCTDGEPVGRLVIIVERLQGASPMRTKSCLVGADTCETDFLTVLSRDRASTANMDQGTKLPRKKRHRDFTECVVLGTWNPLFKSTKKLKFQNLKKIQKIFGCSQLYTL